MKKNLDKIRSLLFGKTIGDEAKTSSTDRETSSAEESANTVKPIFGTPFGIVKRGQNDHLIIFGKHLITSQSFINERQAMEWCNKTDWATILNVVGIYIEHVLEEKKISNQIKK